MIVGVDEVGRGPWAGPLVMAAVVLDSPIEGLTDSKKLSKKRREELNDVISNKAKAIGIGWVHAEELDEMGMSKALTECCLRALRQIKVPFHEIIIDGTVNILKGTSLEQHVTTMKKADLLMPSVSAASIVAKVARDRFMTEQDAVFPGYNFASHAGYGTAAHALALDTIGPCQLHRMSFAPLMKYRESPANALMQPRVRRIFSKLTSQQPAELAPDKSGLKQSSAGRDVFSQKIGHVQSASKHPREDSLTTRTIGDRSETAAAEELVRCGHEIIARNWKTKYCEIDIVSRKGGILYFIEVKHRKNAKSGDGLTAITTKKLHQMKFAAEFYLHSNKLSTECVLMAVSTSGDEPTVRQMLEIT